jgi:hypothetical protein
MRAMRLPNSGVVLGLAAALLAGSGAARAGILYQTGFEAPTYTTGELLGQDGWSTAVPGTAQVQTTTVLSGTQALEVDLTSATFPAHPLNYDSSADPGAVVRLQVSLMLQGTLADQVEGIAVYGDEGFIAQLYVAGSSFTLGGASSHSGDTPAAAGVWYSLEMDLDFQNQTATAYVDGQLLATVDMATPTTSLEFFEFGGFGRPSASETAFYDDFSATVAPEPSSLALIAVGGVSLTGWRRWKTRRVARSVRS